jgi:predicted transcriptional regulator
MSDNKLVRLTIGLPSDVHLALEEMAEEAFRPIADLVRDAVLEHLASDRWQGIGTAAAAMLRKGMTNQEVLAEIRQRFPTANTTAASVAWYRSDLRKKGEDVPTDVQARRTSDQ